MKARTVCLNAEGSAGGLLVVGESPGRDEDLVGRPFVGASGRLLRPLIKKHWSGPVAYDNAVRCRPVKTGKDGTKIKDRDITMCRPFLGQTLDEVKPSRILALGAIAAYSVLGRVVSPFSNRRGYGWLRSSYGPPVPVMMVLHPAAALRNKFVERWFLRDIEWALRSEPQQPPWDGIVNVVESELDAQKAVAALREAPHVTFDVETAGKMWSTGFELLCVGCGPPDGRTVWVWGDQALADTRAWQHLVDLLTDARVPKVAQNGKYDVATMRYFGTVTENVAVDTRLWRKLLAPESNAQLDKMAEIVGMGGIKEETHVEQKAIVAEVKRALSKVDAGAPLRVGLCNVSPAVEAALRSGAPVDSYKFKLIPQEMLYRYNGRDVSATARIAEVLSKELDEEPDLRNVWETIVLPASQAIERVESWGVPVSRDAISLFDVYLEQREIAATAKLSQYSDVNWNSPAQVGELLFKTLGLKPVVMIDSNVPSTNKATLKKLGEVHPVPAALLDYRFVSKMRGTYASGMLKHVRDDGRIHPNILLDGARSGRTSCNSPNLQNIPRVDTVEGTMARDCFAVSPGFQLIELDYSQLELRIAALLSEDPVMRQIFEEGVDFHRRTAELVAEIAWGIQPEQVEDKHRSLAKGVNFGVLYGKTTRSLAEEWGVPVAKAQAIVDAIMGQFKELAKWCKAQLRATRLDGVTWTWWDGRKARCRPLYRVADQDRDDAGRRITAENSAVNTPIQGTASDFCVRSLAECVRWIEEDGIEEDVKLVLAVHDSLMFEVREHMVDEVVGTVKEIMSGWNSAGVPLVVDAKVGPSWGSMKDVA